MANLVNLRHNLRNHRYYSVTISLSTQRQIVNFIEEIKSGEGRRSFARNCSSTRLHELILRLELYLPYAPLPGGGGILPAVSGSGASGGCRPVLLGGVDLSMSAAVQPPVATLPTNLTSSGPIAAHNSLHHTSGGGLALPLGAAAGPPVMMPRPPPGAMPPLGPTLPPTHQDEDLADAAPNQDVLLALLARNKNLEGK